MGLGGGGGVVEVSHPIGMMAGLLVIMITVAIAIAMIVARLNRARAPGAKVKQTPLAKQEISASPEPRNPAVLPRINPKNTASWKKLETLAGNKQRYGLRNLFARDPQRVERFLVKLNAHLEADFSKNLIDEETLDTLLNLAEDVSLKDAAQKMFDGEKINETEHRAVLHAALRNVKRDATGKLAAANGPILVDGQDVMPKVI